MKLTKLLASSVLLFVLVECLLAEKSIADNNELTNQGDGYFSNLQLIEQAKEKESVPVQMMHIARRNNNRRPVKRDRANLVAQSNARQGRQGRVAQKPRSRPVQKQQRKPAPRARQPRPNARNRAPSAQRRQPQRPAARKANPNARKPAVRRPNTNGRKQPRQKPRTVGNGKIRLRLKPRRAGATCSDQATNCAQFISFCSTADYKSILNQYCSMTCGNCDREDADCFDATGYENSCSAWDRKGFCDAQAFDMNLKRSLCSATCGLCLAPVTTATQATQPPATQPPATQPPATQAPPASSPSSMSPGTGPTVSTLSTVPGSSVSVSSVSMSSVSVSSPSSPAAGR
ncbi:hypothetical protein M3Y97_00641900 [Aphelenchoides bicaudatus]|nr:hypothetical protein M3Y97_00641900 [Aphelenchoides bicaudatus]